MFTHLRLFGLTLSLDKNKYLIYFYLIREPVVFFGFMSVVVYGAFMEPTPESFSISLVVWAILALPAYAVSLRHIHLLVLYLLPLLAILFIGSVQGIIFGVTPIGLIRDSLSVLFWCFTPVFIYFLIFSSSKYFGWMSAIEMVRFISAIAGMLLSVRYVLDLDEGFGRFLNENVRENLEYLSSEPLVTFAFAYFAVTTFRVDGTVKPFIYFVLACLSAIGLVAVTYRGPLLIGIGLMGASALILSARKINQFPFRVIFVLFLFLAALWFMAPVVEQVFDKIGNKFERVGANSKVDEFLAIFLSAETFSETLFGLGFGAEKYVVGAGTTVTYTHNLFSYLFLKVGLTGVVLFLVAVFFGFSKILVNNRLLSLLLPEVLTILYISMFQGAFKHYGFAVLMGICIATVIAMTKLKNKCQDGRHGYSRKASEYSFEDYRMRCR
ncbi:MAG: hypothetical protein OQK94_03745 [Gammaproteobacteria bacterium]|nr:hypothetical protein [Gammaproteobacteria bacterium]MCW8840447.1 hypothetical protein [Gammaproteobacteria bacterium]MCW8959143.1 hypothetical protein [Gammaproteobacteria bacterium]MCW8993302.1 hypothetical protein [Gammaproteobacteria bacterium]